MSVERRTLCMRIIARDDSVYRVALEYPTNLRMSNGEIYEGGKYSTSSNISATNTGAATVLDLGGVFGEDAIDRDEVESRKWDSALVYVFYTDWANPVEDDEELGVFELGKIHAEDDRYVVELMGIEDKLNQSTGRIHTPGCQNVFTDTHVDGTIIASDKSWCGLPWAAHVYDTEITAIATQQSFTIDHNDQPNDWFGFGEIMFLSGPNAGTGYKIIKSYSASGAVAISEPFFYPIQVGDQVRLLAGCRKRRDEDCRQKYNNVANFNGFPDVPMTSTVSKFGDQ